jgi:hypothetical protein
MESIKLYKKGIVYKLFGLDNNNKEVIYIGATVNLLCNRKALHKYHHKIYNEGIYKRWCSSYYIYDNCSDIKIEPLEIIENCTKIQLREIEDTYMKKYDCINKNYAVKNIDRRRECCRKSAKKYYYKNLEQEREKKKQYYKNNREACLLRVKENYKKNYEKMKQYQKEYNKEYFKRPDVIQKIKQYREDNKDKLKAYSKERYNRIKNNNNNNNNNNISVINE